MKLHGFILLELMLLSKRSKKTHKLVKKTNRVSILVGIFGNNYELIRLFLFIYYLLVAIFGKYIADKIVAIYGYNIYSMYCLLYGYLLLKRLYGHASALSFVCELFGIEQLDSFAMGHRNILCLC